MFNPLIYPFLFATLVYGIGFAIAIPLGVVGDSSLLTAMTQIGPHISMLWGWTAIVTIFGGMTFLMFNIPPFGKVSGLVGFMLWGFAGMCYALTGAWLALFAVAIPNMFFWFWQYLSLSKFRAEDSRDRKTMKNYDTGQYDDELNPKDGKIDRDNNRGRDVQSAGSYDSPDNGGDSSRVL